MLCFAELDGGMCSFSVCRCALRSVAVKCDIYGGALYTCVVTWCVVLCGIGWWDVQLLGVSLCSAEVGWWDDVDVRFRGCER